jgi:hypothetical protein
MLLMIKKYRFVESEPINNNKGGALTIPDAYDYYINSHINNKNQDIEKINI